MFVRAILLSLVKLELRLPIGCITCAVIRPKPRTARYCWDAAEAMSTATRHFPSLSLCQTVA